MGTWYLPIRCGAGQRHDLRSAAYMWLLHQSQLERIKLQPFLPWQSRIDLNNFTLSPEETSRLLIEMFYAFAQRQDEKSIDVLVEALKRGHQNNSYVLAGLLLRAME